MIFSLVDAYSVCTPKIPKIQDKGAYSGYEQVLMLRSSDHLGT